MTSQASHATRQVFVVAVLAFTTRCRVNAINDLCMAEAGQRVSDRKEINGLSRWF